MHAAHIIQLLISSNSNEMPFRVIIKTTYTLTFNCLHLAFSCVLSRLSPTLFNISLCVVLKFNINFHIRTHIYFTESIAQCGKGVQN